MFIVIYDLELGKLSLQIPLGLTNFSHGPILSHLNNDAEDLDIRAIITGKGADT